MKLLLLIFTVFLSRYSFCNEWAKLYESNDITHEVSISYNKSSKYVLVSYRSAETSQHKQEIFDIKSIELINKLSSSLSIELTKNKFKPRVIKEALIKVEKLKSNETKVIDTGDSPLLVFKPIKEAGRDQGNVVDISDLSQGIFDKLVLALDEKLVIQKILVYSKEISHPNFNVKRNGDTYFLFQGKDLLFSFESALPKRSLIKIRKNNVMGIENFDKIIYLVRRSEDLLKSSKIYDSSNSDIEKKNEVVLSNENVSHREVVRSPGSDRFFQSVKIGELSFTEFYNFEKLQNRIQSEFVSCMNNFTYGEKSSSHLDSSRVRKDCVTTSELEALVVEKIEKNFSLLGEGDLFSKKIKGSLVTCLDNLHFFKDSLYFREFSYPLDVPKDGLMKCIKEMVDSVTIRELLSEIENDFELQTFFIDEEGMETYKSGVESEIKKCLEVKNKEYCLDASIKNRERLALEVFLENLLRKIEINEETSLRLISNVHKCEASDISKCFRESFIESQKHLKLFSISKSIHTDFEILYSQEDEKKFQVEYSRCLANIIERGALIEYANSLVEKSFECQFLSYKTIVSSGGASSLVLMSPYSNFEKDEIESLELAFKIYIRKLVDPIRNVHELRQLISSLEDIALIPFTNYYINQNLTSLSLDSEQKSTIRKFLLSIVNGDSKKSFQHNLDDQIRLLKNKKYNFNTRVFLNQLLISFEKKIAIYNYPIRFNVFIKCLDKYNPQKKIPSFITHTRYCERALSFDKK